MTFSSVSIATGQEGPDRCRDILIYAAHNQNQSLSINSMSSDVKSLICSGQENNDTLTDTKGGGIKIFGTGSGNLSLAKQNIHSVKSNSCSSGESALTKDNLDKVLSDIVDHDAVAAWKSCMEAGGSGLVGTIERAGQSAIVRLQWYARYGVDQVRIVNIDIAGLECTNNIWPKDTVVNSVRLNRLCKAIPNSDMLVAIQTDKDSVTLRSPEPTAILPSPEPPKPQLSSRERCFSGESDQCRLLAQSFTQNCGGNRTCEQNGINYNDIAGNLESVSRDCKNNDTSMQCVAAQKRLDQSIDIAKGRLEPPPPGFPIDPSKMKIIPLPPQPAR